MDTTALDRLASKLTTPGAEPLSEIERSLLVEALAQLAADQTLITRQRRMLLAHGAGAAAIDALLTPSLAALADHASDPNAGAGLDAAAAHRRREDLALAAENAASGREIVRAVLGFVRDLVAAR